MSNVTKMYFSLTLREGNLILVPDFNYEMDRESTESGKHHAALSGYKLPPVKENHFLTGYSDHTGS